MARIQTRKNVTLRKDLHDRLEAWCRARGKAKSRVIEELLADLPPVATTTNEGMDMAMRNEFQVHLLNDAGLDKATQLGEIFSEALDKIEKLVPAGRPRSLVVTKLQEASYWAKRGIAEDTTNQKAG